MLAERILVNLQRALPQHAISRLAQRLAGVRRRSVKNLMIRIFVRRFGIDLDQAAWADPDAYATFQAFFTRPLAAGARRIVAEAGAIACPVDGVVSQAGEISDGRLLQAKGLRYTAAELLGDATAAEQYHGGSFATLYLSPRDYHRVHMPVDGTLRWMRHMPGRLFSVNAATVRALPRLFTVNERVACEFHTDAGPMAMVLVGALNVGGIETVWAGPVTPTRSRQPRTWSYDKEAVTLPRGAEMGRFNLGSTVIVLFPAGRCRLAEQFTPGARVQMGERMGELGGPRTEPGSP